MARYARMYLCPDCQATFITIKFMYLDQAKRPVASCPACDANCQSIGNIKVGLMDRIVRELSHGQVSHAS